MIKEIILKVIKIYQCLISPIIGRECRFYPSCSNYTLGAINKYGTIKGSFLGMKRILKCHPFHSGGVDLP